MIVSLCCSESCDFSLLPTEKHPNSARHSRPTLVWSRRPLQPHFLLPASSMKAVTAKPDCGLFTSLCFWCLQSFLLIIHLSGMPVSPLAECSTYISRGDTFPFMRSLSPSHPFHLPLFSPFLVKTNLPLSHTQGIHTYTHVFLWFSHSMYHIQSCYSWVRVVPAHFQDVKPRDKWGQKFILLFSCQGMHPPTYYVYVERHRFLFHTKEWTSVYGLQQQLYPSACMPFSFFLPGHMFIEGSDYLCISDVPGYNALYIRSFINFNEGVKCIYWKHLLSPINANMESTTGIKMDFFADVEEPACLILSISWFCLS